MNHLGRMGNLKSTVCLAMRDGWLRVESRKAATGIRTNEAVLAPTLDGRGDLWYKNNPQPSKGQLRAREGVSDQKYRARRNKLFKF